MFRLVALLLVLLMPLQFVWGAAAAYCGHESTSETALQVTKHFGHHEHVHRMDAKKAADSKLVGDNDCGTCHATAPVVPSNPLGASAVPFASRRYVIAPAVSPASAHSRAPDRPQWPSLA